MTKRTFLALSILSAILIALIFQFITKPQVVGWDEAWYILHGYKTYKAIRTFDLPSLDWLTFKQTFYPFFHRWYLGLANLPFRYSIMSARLMCLLLLWPTILLLWQTSRELRPKSKLMPYLGVGLYLSSPIIIYYFSTAMMEGMALCLTLLSLWLFWRGIERKKLVYFFLSGISAQALFFTKYNYAMLLWPVLILESLIWLIKNGRRWFLLIGLFGPIFFITLWWILQPGNWNVVYKSYLVNFSEFPSSWITHLLFYPQEMALSYTFSWVAFGLLLIGFVWAAAKYYRQPRVRSLVVLFLINFLIMEFKVPFKTQARYLLSTYFGFFLVGALGLVDLWPKLKKIHFRSLVLGLLAPALLLLTIIMARDLVQMPFMIKPVGSHNFGNSAFYEPDFQNNTRFNFKRNQWPHQSPPAGTEKVEDIFEYAMQNVDPAKEVIQVAGPVNEISTLMFDYYLEQARDANPAPKEIGYQKYWVVFEVIPGRILGHLEANQTHADPNVWVKQALSYPGLQTVTQRIFPYLGVKLTILAE